MPGTPLELLDDAVRLLREIPLDERAQLTWLLADWAAGEKLPPELRDLCSKFALAIAAIDDSSPYEWLLAAGRAAKAEARRPLSRSTQTRRGTSH